MAHQSEVIYYARKLGVYLAMFVMLAFSVFR